MRSSFLRNTKLNFRSILPLRGKDKELSNALKPLLGYAPRYIDIYRIALTHKSSLQAKNAYVRSNERLEFLGDSLLGTIVAEKLFAEYPSADEGFMSQMRARIVNRQVLNEIGRKMHLLKLMEDVQILKVNPIQSPTILGNTFEALVAAIYLDKGYQAAAHFFNNMVISHYLNLKDFEENNTNFKSLLIEWGHRHSKSIEFGQAATEMRQNKLYFTVSSIVDGREMETGAGWKKKDAEQEAARKTLNRLGEL